MQTSPAAKYALGTKIEIAGQPTKADNGRFVITLHLPQPDGNDYWAWKRLGKDGKQLPTESTNNHRGGRATRLDAIAKIIA